MARRAKELPVTLANALETARRASGLSQDGLWFLYKQKGGEIGLAAFKNYLRGSSDPQWHDYDIIAECLNEALGEERLPRVPFQRGSTDDGLRNNGTSGGTTTSFSRVPVAA
jgi:hypothetical protein